MLGDPIAELWERVVEVPSALGRLLYVADLRNVQTGAPRLGRGLAARMISRGRSWSQAEKTARVLIHEAVTASALVQLRRSGLAPSRPNGIPLKEQESKLLSRP